MKKKILSAILAIAMVLSLSSCKEKAVTFEEKKEYVESNYSRYITNDFRSELPFDDMIGLPLAELKQAIETSEKWTADTSMWADVRQIAKLDVDSDYSFSNREGNATGSSDGSILGQAVEGGINFLSAKYESATYVAVVTDDSSQQLITDVYITITNTGCTEKELADQISSTYKYVEYIDNDEDGSADVSGYIGLIADVNYEGIYDYDHGLTTEYPVCLGTLQHYYAEDNLILRIFSLAEYVEE